VITRKIIDLNASNAQMFDGLACPHMSMPYDQMRAKTASILVFRLSLDFKIGRRK